MPNPQSHQAVPAAQHSDKTSSLRSVYTAATNLFLANSFQSVSLRQIAESAGVPQGSLHKLIGSKDDLLYQLLVRFEHGLLEEIKQQLPRATGCQTAMRRFAEIYIKYGAARRTDLLLARRDMHLLSQEHQHSIRRIRDKLVTQVWEISDPSGHGLFKWLLASFLVGKIIRSSVAVEAYRNLVDRHGFDAAAKLAQCSHRDLVRLASLRRQ